MFDKAVQTTNTWLDEIVDELGPSKQNAWQVLGAVLRTLRDRLPLDLAVHLGAQLPLLVRGCITTSGILRRSRKRNVRRRSSWRRLSRGFR